MSTGDPFEAVKNLRQRITGMVRGFRRHALDETVMNNFYDEEGNLCPFCKLPIDRCDAIYRAQGEQSSSRLRKAKFPRARLLVREATPEQ